MPEQEHHADIKSKINRYVEICNNALAQSSGRFPFSCILQAVQESGKSPKVRVALKGDPRDPDQEMRLENGRIVIMPCDAGQSAAIWKLCPDYLEDVLARPQNYTENPALLDWDWLYSR